VKENGRIKEIQQLLSTAKQDVSLKTCKKQCKLLVPLALILGFSFMAQTAYAYALCKLSNDIKETSQITAKLQRDLAHVHAHNLRPPTKKNKVL